MCLVNGKGQFLTPVAPKFGERSTRNSKLRNTSSGPPHTPNMVKIGLGAWAGPIPSLSHHLHKMLVNVVVCTRVVCIFRCGTSHRAVSSAVFTPTATSLQPVTADTVISQYKFTSLFGRKGMMELPKAQQSVVGMPSQV